MDFSGGNRVRPPAFLLNFADAEEVVVDVGILTLKFAN